MATKFLEPGGDADFLVGTTKGFWSAIGGTPAVATDFVHGNHLKSIKYRPNQTDYVQTNSFVDAGCKESIDFYFVTLPSATASIFKFSGGFPGVSIRLTSGGVLQLWKDSATVVQIGSNGSTLSTGVWYRLCFASTFVSASVNEFRLYKDGVLDVSASNISLSTGNSIIQIGNISGDSTLDFRSSDHYVDDSSSLTDTGNIWVTAKRPNANGTTNGFTTQIGSGGSGYGSGHSPQVNERPLSNTNGWSLVGAGSAVTEEYNVEAMGTGDISLNYGSTIIDWLGWVDIKSLAGETVQIILDGVNFAQAITSTETLYTKIKGSTTYPSGTGADIGVTTDTSLTTVSLYECGILIAYIPNPITFSPFPSHL